MKWFDLYDLIFVVKFFSLFSLENQVLIKIFKYIKEHSLFD